MLIEKIADSDMLYRISENCLKAISDTQLHKTYFHQRLCLWYIKQIEKHCALSDGYLELLLKVIVESGTSLPEANVEEYCHQFSTGDCNLSIRLATMIAKVFMILMELRSIL